MQSEPAARFRTWSATANGHKQSHGFPSRMSVLQCRRLRYQQGNKEFADTRFYQGSRGIEGLGARKD